MKGGKTKATGVSVPTSAPAQEIEYVVERILDSRMRNGKKEYFLSWKGYGP
jgi:hypothetical protein